ncbi:unnamed protein product, partial [Ectocarpus fasciculatus]
MNISQQTATVVLFLKRGRSTSTAGCVWNLCSPSTLFLLLAPRALISDLSLSFMLNRTLSLPPSLSVSLAPLPYLLQQRLQRCCRDRPGQVLLGHEDVLRVGDRRAGPPRLLGPARPPGRRGPGALRAPPVRGGEARPHCYARHRGPP